MLTYDKTCPICGGAMVLRRNKQTDEQFYGCSFYPKCTGTRPVEEDDEAEMPSDRYKQADRNRWRE